MAKVTVVLSGGPHSGECVEVERGSPYIEVAMLKEPCNVLTDRNCSAAIKAEYKRSLYKLSNNSDLEYVYCESKK